MVITLSVTGNGQYPESCKMVVVVVVTENVVVC